MLHDACFQWSFLSQREEFMAFSYLFFHVRRLFHSISLHWRSGRIVSTFNNCDTSTTWSYIWIYGDVYCQASNEEVNMRPCAIFRKISWTPELPTRKQHDFRWFLPHPNMENQPISHSAINTWHMVNSEIGVGQLAWILGQATKISWKKNHLMQLDGSYIKIVSDVSVNVVAWCTYWIVRFTLLIYWHMCLSLIRNTQNTVSFKSRFP